VGVIDMFVMVVLCMIYAAGLLSPMAGLIYGWHLADVQARASRVALCGLCGLVASIGFLSAGAALAAFWFRA